MTQHPGVPGKRAHVRMSPRPVGSDEADAWEAARPPAQGEAHLFRFPFPIFFVPGLQAVAATRDGHRWTLYPPFEARARDLIKDGIELARVPRPVGSPVPGSDGLTVYQRLAPQFGPAHVGDSLRIDAIPPVETEAVESILYRVLTQLRSRTFQWWISRDDRAFDSYLKQAFRIDANGHYEGPVESVTSYYVPIGIERAVEQHPFAQSLGGALSSTEPPLFFSLFLDGIYQHCAEQLREATLNLAMACEDALDHYLTEVAEKRSVSASKLKKLRRAPFESRLDGGAYQIVGHSFAKSDPQCYRSICDLWVCRGSVAHSGPLVRPAAPGSRPVTDEDVLQWGAHTARLLEWLRLQAAAF